MNLSKSIIVKTVSRCINALLLGIWKAKTVLKLSSLSKIRFAIFSIEAASVLSEIPIASTSLLSTSSSPPSNEVVSSLSNHLGMSLSLKRG